MINIELGRGESEKLTPTLLRPEVVTGSCHSGDFKADVFNVSPWLFRAGRAHILYQKRELISHLVGSL